MAQQQKNKPAAKNQTKAGGKSSSNMTSAKGSKFKDQSVSSNSTRRNEAADLQDQDIDSEE